MYAFLGHKFFFCRKMDKYEGLLPVKIISMFCTKRTGLLPSELHYYSGGRDTLICGLLVPDPIYPHIHLHALPTPHLPIYNLSTFAVNFVFVSVAKIHLYSRPFWSENRPNKTNNKNIG